MDSTRREFLYISAVAGAAAALGAAKNRPGDKGSGGGKGKRILILGGTAFLGPHIVESARGRGHMLTLFNRGKTNPGLFPDVETLNGDRRGNLKALEGRSWDAVVDTSGYMPRDVRDSTGLLKDAVKQYVFVSSISVYADTSKPGMDESAPVAKLPAGVDESIDKFTPETYGPLKALCEQAAEKVMPGRVANVRPGLIVGPGDRTDRFTYWPARVARGGEVLAPGSPDDPVQFIDARDLAAWIVTVIETNTVGVYNAVGPDTPCTIGQLLEACKAAAKSDARLVWADAKFLDEQKVAAWSDMPVWVAPSGEEAGFSKVSFKRALDRGLRFRPVAETVKDTLAWWKGLPEDRRASLKAGIKPEREAEVLAAWHKLQTPKA
jgi:2'-hydroxyisoflavone reductase